MNNWLRIGVPILVVVLLVISAVSITIAITKDNTAKQVASPSYTLNKTADTQYARGGLCPNCPGYGQGTTGDQGTATCLNCGCGYRNGGCQGRCWDNDDQGNSTAGSLRSGCVRCR